MCVSNRGVRWGLLTDVVVIGRGSQDVSEPLTCPLPLSTPLSPHIDHPATHHWSGKPGTSALLRHTLRLTRLSVLPCTCVCEEERERKRMCVCVCVCGRGMVNVCVYVWNSFCALVCLSLWMLDRPLCLSGHAHTQTPFITHTKGLRNLKACC